MKYEILIKGNLAKLNEHDNANRRNRFAGAGLKAAMTELVRGQLDDAPHIEKPVRIGFVWYYSSKHDFDNISFAKKYVLDGLVKAGVLPNDNPKWVRGFDGEDFVKVDKGGEGVLIKIREVKEL